jgi:hypothetical protein
MQPLAILGPTVARAPLALPPTYDSVSDNQDAYLFPGKMRVLASETKRYWAFHSVPTTVALPGNRFAKSLNSFTDHAHDEPRFRELLREYAELGVPRPSGYADVFHETFKSPRVSWSINSQLAPCFAGGWQESLSPGCHFGRYYRYDMRSAYLWAATLGLPDTRTYTRSLDPWKGKHDGLYRIKLQCPTKGAPFPFNQARECIATNLEIEAYDLRVEEVIDGVIWKNTVGGDKILDAIQKVSTWKQAGRAYWGRWAQMAKVECVSPNKRWYLPNIALNIPWAHLIVSRVKMRLWEHANRAVHVYVDSVITTDKLPTGDSLGDWRLERTYDHGVLIKAPGQYGCLIERRLEKMAGVAANSPQRSNPAAVA